MPSPLNLDALIQKHASLNGLNPALLRAVISQESGGNPRAVSSAGAQGLMQLMPSTGRALGVTNPFDAEQNIAAGARYLKQQLDAFGGDVPRALAAYNAGPAAVKKYGGVPPFAETQNYVRSITSRMSKPSPLGYVPPAASTPRANLANLSGAFGQGGTFDPAAFLAALSAAGNAAPAHTYYDPFSPTETDIPLAPAKTLAGLFGFDASALPAQYTQVTPSLDQQRNDAEQQAVNNTVTESEKEQARLKSIANLYKAQADVLANHPMPNRTVPDLPSYPQRLFAPFPDRPAPQIDKASAILGTLAGIIDPGNAGQFASIPLQTGIHEADQQYAERLQRYQVAAQQLAQQYEDQLAARNEQIQQARAVSNVNFANAAAQRDAALAQGNLGAQEGAANEQAGVLGGFIPREQASMQANLKAQQLGRTIGQELQSNAAANNYDLKTAQNDANNLRNLLMFGGRVYGAQERLQGVQDTNSTRSDIANSTNQTRSDIAAGQNSARLQAATTRANATIKAAEIRANAIQANVNGTVSKLPPGQREQVQFAGRNWTNAVRAAIQAQKDALKAYANDFENNTKMSQDQYLANYVAPFEAKAEQYRQQYFTTLQALTGKSAPAPAAPAPAPSSSSKIDSILQRYGIKH